MNEKKRDKLRDALTHITAAAALVDIVKTREEISIENTPENLQGTAKYDAMEEAVESMEDACDKLDEAKELIECAMELIKHAINTR